MTALFERLLKELRESDTIGPVFLAISIGIVGGIGAILFRYLIEGAHFYFFEGGAAALPWLGDAYVILLPPVGLLLVAFMVRRWAPEAQGHGVPEVMYAVKKEGGRIRPRVALIKALASAFCIGSGGSVGREGPIVQIGCTFGSTVGQLLGLSEERVKLMVACGAAAGVAGTFNAPIAGVIFALEVILGNFRGRAFGLVVIASVTSTALCQSILGTEPAFPLEKVFALHSAAELPLYLILGLAAGVVALAFVRTLYFFENIFERWPWHWAFKAMLGGLALGAIAWVMGDSVLGFGGQHLFGVGYEGIESSLAGTMALKALLVLIILKILATSLTLGAGGSGGVFAPSLFIGAMVGGAFGVLVNMIFPGIETRPGAFALVGMAAVFAGTAHAPITAIVILFEMTDDYKIILPLMMSAVLSYLIAIKLSPDSIYTIKLRRRGGLAPKKPEATVIDLVLVADAMEPDSRGIPPDTLITKLAKRFHREHARAYPVIDEKEELIGIVSESDVETALMAGDIENRTAGDIMTRSVFTCTRDQSLREVLRLLKSKDFARIPVVDTENPKKVVGVLPRKEIFWAYGAMATDYQRMLDKTGVAPPEHAEDSVQVELEVRPAHQNICDRKVKDIRLPENCLIVMLRRADRAIIPRGKTVIEPGDTLVMLTSQSNASKLREWVAALEGE